MQLNKAVEWFDGILEPWNFDDVSNNGVQIAGGGDGIDTVAFAVDASLKSVRAAAECGAKLLVVHHGISWGGGIKRIADGVYNVVKAAIDADIAIYASHLPLDANPKFGNNVELAKQFSLVDLEHAFSYHGNVIGYTGVLTDVSALPDSGLAARAEFRRALSALNVAGPVKIGVCSGGAGEFAEQAKSLGCDIYVTGEASWGDVIAAENCGMAMVCLGHYETEVFGVRALASAMKREFDVKTVDLTECAV